MEIKQLSTDSITGYEKNYRTTTEKGVEALKRSIDSVGFVVPIVIDKDNVIISGHLRLAVAKEIGMEEVPCVLADNLTDKQVKKLRYLDNEVHRLSKWDDALLADEKRWLELMSKDDGWEFISNLFGESVLNNYKIDDIIVTSDSILKKQSDMQKQFTERATAKTITTERNVGGKLVAQHICPNCNKEVFTGIK